MLKIILLFIISIGFVTGNGSLDVALENFLALSKERSFVRRKDVEAKNLYGLFKMEMDRETSTKSEEETRFSAFNQTLHDIINHRQQAVKSYSIGLTHLADWTAEELKVLREGVKIPSDNEMTTNISDSKTLLNSTGKSRRATSSIPTAYDLTTLVVKGTSVPVVSFIFNLLFLILISLFFYSRFCP